MEIASGRDVARWGLACACALAACSPVADVRDARNAASALVASGPAVSARRLSTEPDLIGWDPGWRAKIVSIARHGVVIARLENSSDGATLEILPRCTSVQFAYEFSPYAEREHHTATTAAELRAVFPFGVAMLAPRLTTSRGLRADYRLAGVDRLPPQAMVGATNLIGECSGATHFVVAIHRGIFAIGAGETSMLAVDAPLLPKHQRALSLPKSTH